MRDFLIHRRDTSPLDAGLLFSHALSYMLAFGNGTEATNALSRDLHLNLPLHSSTRTY